MLSNDLHQVSAKAMDELHALSDLVDFLREYPEECTEKRRPLSTGYAAISSGEGSLLKLQKPPITHCNKSAGKSTLSLW